MHGLPEVQATPAGQPVGGSGPSHLSVFASLLVRLYQPAVGLGYAKRSAKATDGSCEKPLQAAPGSTPVPAYCAGQGRHVSPMCA